MKKKFFQYEFRSGMFMDVTHWARDEKEAKESCIKILWEQILAVSMDRVVPRKVEDVKPISEDKVVLVESLRWEMKLKGGVN